MWTHVASTPARTAAAFLPLILIHGAADDNVYLIHSLRLVDALLRAGRPFEFVPLPGFTHGVREPDMTVQLYSRIMAFFDEHLR